MTIDHTHKQSYYNKHNYCNVHNGLTLLSAIGANSLNKTTETSAILHTKNYN